jgi:hypothetical protein
LADKINLQLVETRTFGSGPVISVMLAVADTPTAIEW